MFIPTYLWILGLGARQNFWLSRPTKDVVIIPTQSCKSQLSGSPFHPPVDIHTWATRDCAISFCKDDIKSKNFKTYASVILRWEGREGVSHIYTGWGLIRLENDQIRTLKCLIFVSGWHGLKCLIKGGSINCNSAEQCPLVQLLSNQIIDDGFNVQTEFWIANRFRSPSLFLFNFSFFHCDTDTSSHRKCDCYYRNEWMLCKYPRLIKC